MIKIDVNEKRFNDINTHKLSGVDGNYTFYYDETNNSRKFHLEDEKFNVPYDQNFILGGVVDLGTKSDYRVNELFESLKLQKNIDEVKFKYIAYGEFIDCLKSRKLKKVLEWVLESDLYIHHVNLNTFYYAIVDIVDSAIQSSSTSNAFNLMYANQVKNDLYLVLNENIDRTMDLFYKYEYPNIKPEKIVLFIDAILEIIDPYRYDESYHFGIETLRQLLKEAKRSKDLPFIMNEKDRILIEDFSQFYMHPIYLFKNSKHYFDNEDEIENIFADYMFMDKEKEIRDYAFVDSKKYDLVQLSDVIVGILGRYYTFIRNNSESEIKSIISELNENEKDIIRTINKLILKSDNKCKAFLFKSVSNDEKIKAKYLLGLK